MMKSAAQKQQPNPRHLPPIHQRNLYHKLHNFHPRHSRKAHGEEQIVFSISSEPVLLRPAYSLQPYLFQALFPRSFSASPTLHTTICPTLLSNLGSRNATAL
jgi:hypothetical protein